jgi:RNase H-fold protein (predicted Holliday junction resolvase)
VGRSVCFDAGERRIGVAISDATGILARPVGVIAISRLDVTAAEARR